MLTEFLNYLNKIKRFEISFGQKRYYCDIIAISDDKIRVTYPIYQGKSPQLNISDKIDVFLYCEGGIYSAQTEVLVLEYEPDGAKIMEISYPKEVKHSQRREYLRAKIEAPYLLKCTLENGENRTFEGNCRNICGKGVNFLLKEQLKECVSAQIELKVNGRKILSSAQLVYSQPILTGEALSFSTAFILTSIDNDDMEHIIKECFLFQLQERRARLNEL